MGGDAAVVVGFVAGRGGTGEFTYTYPIDVPAPAGGTAPTARMSYSSGSVGKMPVEWPRFSGMCWDGYNATLSLGGTPGR